MTAAWPGTVNQFAMAGSLRESPERNIADFTPEVGPPKQRRRSSISTDMVSFDALLTFTEWDALVAFYRTTLLDGVSSFTRKHPRDVTGSDYTWRFVAEPKITGDEGYQFARVAIALRKMP